MHIIPTARGHQPWTAPTAASTPNRRRHPDDPLPPAPREAETWRLLAAGYTDRQIAAAMGVSVHTVRSACVVLRLKLGVASRAELARLWGERHPPADADDA